MYRFVLRHAPAVAGAPDSLESSPAAEDVLRKLHQTIRKITEDFNDRWHFNTCIAAIMELLNTLTAEDERFRSGAIAPSVTKHVLTNLVLLLAPFAPYLACELWEALGGHGNLLRMPWPRFNEALAKESEVEFPVQINGKLRTVVRLGADAGEPALKEAALGDEKIQAALAGKQVVKMIVVPGKLVNLVVR